MEKNPRNDWRNDEVKATKEKGQVAWKDVFGPMEEEIMKVRCREI